MSVCLCVCVRARVRQGHPRDKGVTKRNHATKEQTISQYKVGRPIQWGAVTSVTTALHAAKSFVSTTRAVFKIRVTSGRNINTYAFFPSKGEILMSPRNHRFTVSSPVHK